MMVMEPFRGVRSRQAVTRRLRIPDGARPESSGMKILTMRGQESLPDLKGGGI